MKLLSVIVPCYNEEETVFEFYSEFKKAISKIPYDYELIFVNDGSNDETILSIKKLSENDEHIRYISFSRNFGKESAMLAGLKNAKGDYVSVMDADLQDPPSLLPEMMELLENSDYDCIATRRQTRKGESVSKRVLSKAFYKLINIISDTKIVDGARDYRLMTRAMVDAILSMNEFNRFSKGMFEWIGFNTHWISFNNVERNSGKSKWNLHQLFKYAIDGIINYSQVPLIISSCLGIIMTVVSAIMLIIIVVATLLYGNDVDGWASTACIIIFVGGLQLFFLGVTSQYIARIFLETKHRPHYIIKESNIKDISKIE